MTVLIEALVEVQPRADRGKKSLHGQDYYIRLHKLIVIWKSMDGVESLNPHKLSYMWKCSHIILDCTVKSKHTKRNVASKSCLQTSFTVHGGYLSVNIKMSCIRAGYGKSKTTKYSYSVEGKVFFIGAAEV